MDPDFPAAHSMDTRWYAIDQHGHVASFFSGEAGAVPMVALDVMRETTGQWWSAFPENPNVFLYEHARRFEDPHLLDPEILGLINVSGPRVSGPYIREETPALPLHVDQLPPAARAVVSAVRFALSFADEQAIQPAEIAPCASDQSEYVTLAGERRPFPPEASDYTR